jgi:hypothetical protein
MQQTVIRLKRRYPTRALAEWEIQFLPTCGWRAVEIGDSFYLEFGAEPHRARRIARYLAETPRVPVEILENV